MRIAYPSDITREQFEVIRGTLEGAKKKTHPPNYELYDIYCAILWYFHLPSFPNMTFWMIMRIGE